MAAVLMVFVCLWILISKYGMNSMLHIKLNSFDLTKLMLLQGYKWIADRCYGKSIWKDEDACWSCGMNARDMAVIFLERVLLVLPILFAPLLDITFTFNTELGHFW